jgi:hypothetical protein
MTSRRELLKVGLAASALPVVTGAGLAVAAEPARTIPLYKVLYDTRFPVSAAFARRAESRGLAVHGISGDMTRFWYDDLYHRWRQGAAAIAGLTAHGALFCLERLAWGERMRVVFRGEHCGTADGAVAHCFEGPAPLLPAASCSVSAAATSWAAALADVVAECPVGRFERQTVRALTATTATLPYGDQLFSWVIAPVARA